MVASARIWRIIATAVTTSHPNEYSGVNSLVQGLSSAVQTVKEPDIFAQMKVETRGFVNCGKVAAAQRLKLAHGQWRQHQHRTAAQRPQRGLPGRHDGGRSRCQSESSCFRAHVSLLKRDRLPYTSLGMVLTGVL